MTLVTYTPDQQKEVLQLLGISGPKNHIDLLFKLGEKYELDILTKEISLIPNKGPFIGVWGRLHIAHRSGRLDGLEMDDEWETEKHYCVRVIVWRKDMGRPAAKVIGRVGKHEGSTRDGKFTPKEWPLEIARARGLRAGLGFAFSIHDAYDTADEDDDEWAGPPDERVTVTGTVVDMATGEVIDAAGPAEEVSQGEPAAAPKRRRTNKNSTPTTGDEASGASTGEVHVESERDPGAAGSGATDATAEVVDSVPTAPEDQDPPTLLVGGHTLAQRLAMAARDADIDDDQTRHGVITFVTRGKYQRGSDIPEDDQAAAERCFDAFAGLGDGSLYMRYAPDGTVAGVYKTKKT